MLSYMLPPVEDKTSSSQQQQQRNINLSLNLNNSNNNQPNNLHHNNIDVNNLRDSCDEEASDENTKLLKSERRKFDNDNNKKDILNSDINKSEIRDEINNKKLKFGSKTGCTTKGTTLKRVSFGSSKGSMVETLVFETPTPLPEHAEREFTFISDSHNNVGGLGKPQTISNNLNSSSCLDDSGIGLQEESERTKVKVTFFQSSKPQQISPPEFTIPFFAENNNSILIDSVLSETNSIDEKMAAATAIPPNYDRQLSTESGWDNPFRPGGDLSKEAEEIVNLIKGGKPITPTGEPNLNIGNGELHETPHENGSTVVDGAIKVEAQPLQATQNGTKSPQNNATTNRNNNDKPSTNGDATSKTQTQISNQVLPAPQSASHVTIEDKKKKKSCCVIQ